MTSMISNRQRFLTRRMWNDVKISIVNPGLSRAALTPTENMVIPLRAMFGQGRVDTMFVELGSAVWVPTGISILIPNQHTETLVTPITKASKLLLCGSKTEVNPLRGKEELIIRLYNPTAAKCKITRGEVIANLVVVSTIRYTRDGRIITE